MCERAFLFALFALLDLQTVGVEDGTALEDLTVFEDGTVFEGGAALEAGTVFEGGAALEDGTALQELDELIDELLGTVALLARPLAVGDEPTLLLAPPEGTDEDAGGAEEDAGGAGEEPWLPEPDPKISFWAPEMVLEISAWQDVRDDEQTISETKLVVVSGRSRGSR